MAGKRKAEGSEAGPSKRARAEDNSDAIALVNTILANPATFIVSPDINTTRVQLITIAQYARTLWLQQNPSNFAAPPPPPPAAANAGKTSTQGGLKEEAEKLRKAALAGIKKQMTWKPSCKTGTAKWLYDGVCSDPAVFGTMMGLNGPPTFKQKKISRDDFERVIGSCVGKARYSDLYITSKDVNVRWSETGEFKISGMYGTYEHQLS